MFRYVSKYFQTIHKYEQHALQNPATMPFHLLFGVDFGLKCAHNPPAFPAWAKGPKKSSDCGHFG